VREGRKGCSRAVKVKGLESWGPFTLTRKGWCSLCVCVEILEIVVSRKAKWSGGCP